MFSHVTACIMARPAGFICKSRPSAATTLMHSGLVSVIALDRSPARRQVPA